MICRWQILNNKLALANGKEFLYPDATVIFKAEFGRVLSYDDCSFGRPSEDLKDLHFFKTPFDVKLKLHLRGEEIFSRLMLFDANKSYTTSLEDLDHGYYIAGNSWLPLIPGKKDDLSKLLLESGITSSILTLRQALELKRNAKVFDITIDENIKDDVALSIKYDDSKYFTATLYPYQKNGFEWMSFMVYQDMGFVLADEMGLGKSIQIIRLICERISKGGKPFLIVSPSSLLENWRREFFKFTSDIKVLIHQGRDRSGSPKFLKLFDVVITSYETLNFDISIFLMISWDLVIIDEAQAIKNPLSQRTNTIKSVPKNVGIAVTGTPFENKLTDVWSIIDFVNPFYLSSQQQFENEFSNNIDGADKLEPLISPLILRRRLSEVAKDLPEKILIEQAITMDESMIEEYEMLRGKATAESTKRNLLSVLLRLRMFCCDPSLIQNSSVVKNNKLERFLDILGEIVSLGEKAIVFTSFLNMSDILQSRIVEKFNIYCKKIDGRTIVAERQGILDQFANVQGPAALILNPKAAGAGLNIVAANNVIHYNMEWNPAIEDQATARAYRRGQDKNVRVFKLFYAETIEEVIEDRLQFKRQISQSAIIGVDGKEFSFSEILKALQVSPKR